MITPRSIPATNQLLNAASQVGLLVAMHPFYPSGHSTQSHLMAQCVGSLFASGSQWPLLLLGLADCISCNREYAGLHFPSDTATGRCAANQTFLVLSALPGFRAIVAAAKLEWAQRGIPVARPHANGGQP